MAFLRAVPSVAALLWFLSSTGAADEPEKGEAKGYATVTIAWPAGNRAGEVVGVRFNGEKGAGDRASGLVVDLLKARNGGKLPDNFDATLLRFKQEGQAQRAIWLVPLPGDPFPAKFTFDDLLAQTKADGKGVVLEGVLLGSETQGELEKNPAVIFLARCSKSRQYDAEARPAPPGKGLAAIQGELPRGEFETGIGDERSSLAIRNGKGRILVSGPAAEALKQREGLVRAVGKLQVGKGGQLVLAAETVEPIKPK